MKSMIAFVIIWGLVMVLIMLGVGIGINGNLDGNANYYTLKKSDWQEIHNYDQCKLDETCVMYVKVKK